MLRCNIAISLVRTHKKAWKVKRYNLFRDLCPCCWIRPAKQNSVVTRRLLTIAYWQQSYFSLLKEILLEDSTEIRICLFVWKPSFCCTALPCISLQSRTYILMNAGSRELPWWMLHHSISRAEIHSPRDYAYKELVETKTIHSSAGGKGERKSIIEQWMKEGRILRVSVSFCSIFSPSLHVKLLCSSWIWIICTSENQIWDF